MTHFNPADIWKRGAVELSILTGSSNTKIAESLVVNLKTSQAIRKESKKFNNDYEATVVRMHLSDRSDKKKNPEFVCEI